MASNANVNSYVRCFTTGSLCSVAAKCSFDSSQVLLPYVKATCDDFYEELRNKADVGLPSMPVSVIVVCVCARSCMRTCVCAWLISVTLMYLSVIVMYVPC